MKEPCNLTEEEKTYCRINHWTHKDFCKWCNEWEETRKNILKVIEKEKRDNE